MTIIKKRGRIVRNIFVIDRYDVLRARSVSGLLGRNALTYSADPNAQFGEPYVGYPAIIFESEKSKQRVLQPYAIVVRDPLKRQKGDRKIGREGGRRRERDVCLFVSFSTLQKLISTQFENSHRASRI